MNRYLLLLASFVVGSWLWSQNITMWQWSKKHSAAETVLAIAPDAGLRALNAARSLAIPLDWGDATHSHLRCLKPLSVEAFNAWIGVLRGQGLAPLALSIRPAGQDNIMIDNIRFEE